jgi:hypothetical protein
MRAASAGAVFAVVAAVVAGWWWPASPDAAAPGPAATAPATGPASTGVAAPQAQHAPVQAATAVLAQEAATAALQASQPLEHMSGDDPRQRYEFREDEGVKRRVVYVPDHANASNPFGGRNWGEGAAAAGMR